MARSNLARAAVNPTVGSIQSQIGHCRSNLVPTSVPGRLSLLSGQFSHVAQAQSDSLGRCRCSASRKARGISLGGGTRITLRIEVRMAVSVEVRGGKGKERAFLYSPASKLRFGCLSFDFDVTLLFVVPNFLVHLLWDIPLAECVGQQTLRHFLVTNTPGRGD